MKLMKLIEWSNAATSLFRKRNGARPKEPNAPRQANNTSNQTMRPLLCLMDELMGGGVSLIWVGYGWGPGPKATSPKRRLARPNLFH